MTRPENYRLSRALCAAVAETLSGSHETREALFLSAGAPGPPPNLPHDAKWKTWLFQAGKDPSVDSLALLGDLIEEFMDLPPRTGQASAVFLGIDSSNEYKEQRARIVEALAQCGLQYFPGGQIVPMNAGIESPRSATLKTVARTDHSPPSDIQTLIGIVARGLPRAMHPLTHRRKGALCLTFESEYDIQDLLHAQLRPWVHDIRPEETTPSHAGSSTRMDFLLAKYSTVIEVKRVRSPPHAKSLGDELILDIDHYQAHPNCDVLWCLVYDPSHLMPNPIGLVNDLTGTRQSERGTVDVRVLVVPG